MKPRWCVRVAFTEPYPANLGRLVECLRYSGFVTVHETDPEGLTLLCFDLEAPGSLRSEPWAKMNAERMRSFGFNAVMAPSTLRYAKEPR